MAANRLRRNLSGTVAIARAAQAFTERSHRALRARPLTDERVHAARKDIRRARAALMLLREAIGRKRFRRENIALRDAARMLNPLRDAKVLAQALRHCTADRPGWRRAAAPLARALQAEQQAARSALIDHDSLQGVLRALRASAARLRRWPVGRRGWSRLGPAFERIYRRARLARRAARTRPGDETLHEWRKQAKNLRHALELLAPVNPRRLDALAVGAHRIADLLGLDHDLALLGQRLRLLARYSQHAGALRASIGRRRRDLQRRARTLGEEVLRPAPRRLADEIGGYWRCWRGR